MRAKCFVLLLVLSAASCSRAPGPDMAYVTPATDDPTAFTGDATEGWFILLAMPALYVLVVLFFAMREEIRLVRNARWYAAGKLAKEEEE